MSVNSSIINPPSLQMTPCLYTHTCMYACTHAYTLLSGLIRVHFLCNLLQGRAANELAWQNTNILFCRTKAVGEVMAPLISPVKPFTTPRGCICLCHKIKNDYYTPAKWVPAIKVAACFKSEEEASAQVTHAKSLETQGKAHLGENHPELFAFKAAQKPGRAHETSHPGGGSGLSLFSISRRGELTQRRLLRMTLSVFNSCFFFWDL